MVVDGTYTAVLDRFEVAQDDDELAVLLLEREGDVVDELVVDRERLPETGRHVDAVFEVTVDDGDLEVVDYQAEATDERGEAAQSRFDRLSERPPDTDEDSDD